MYWPAWYWKRWLAGSCRRNSATSGAGRAIDSTRVGIFSTGNSPAPGTLRASSVQSVCAVAQQVSTMPASSSATLSALSWWAPCSTRPSSSRLLQEPQAPSLQP